MPNQTQQERAQRKPYYRPDCSAINVGLGCLTFPVLCHVIQFSGLALGPQLFVDTNTSILHLASKRLTREGLTQAK